MLEFVSQTTKYKIRNRNRSDAEKHQGGKSDHIVQNKREREREKFNIPLKTESDLKEL